MLLQPAQVMTSMAPCAAISACATFRFQNSSYSLFRAEAEKEGVRSLQPWQESPRL